MQSLTAPSCNIHLEETLREDKFSPWTRRGSEYRVLAAALAEVANLFRKSVAASQAHRQPRTKTQHLVDSLSQDYELSKRDGLYLAGLSTSNQHDTAIHDLQNTDINLDVTCVEDWREPNVIKAECETQQVNDTDYQQKDEVEVEDRGFFTDYGYFTHEPHDPIPAVHDAEDQQFWRHRRCLHLRRKVQCPDIHFNRDYRTIYGNAKGNVDRWDNKIQGKDFAKKVIRMWPWENQEDVYSCDNNDAEKGKNKRKSDVLTRQKTAEDMVDVGREVAGHDRIEKQSVKKLKR